MKNASYLILCGALALVACKGADVDWSGKELKPVEETVAGLSFTISLPDGLKKNDALSSETSIAWVSAGKSASSPSFSVAKLSLPPASLKDAVARSAGKDDIVARQDAVEDGFIVTSHSKSRAMVKVDVYKTVGQEALWCSAMQAKDDGIPKFDEAKGWLEKVCLSASPKGGAKSAPTTSAASAAPTAPAVDVAPEMKDLR